MRKYITLLAIATLCGGMASAKSPKRGVAENQFSLQGQMTPIEPGVCWYYNWGQKPGNGYKGEVAAYEGFEYVPMCWNAAYNEQQIRDHVAAHPECKFLLGFNEPNFKAQANMTPAQAAEAWPKVQELAKELGLKLVSPAVNYSPDGPENEPFTWMTNFINLVGKDAFDYCAIHCYGGAGTLQDMADRMYELTGKQVWVTEFCMWPGGAGDVYVSPEAQIGDMINSLKYMEKSDMVFRYAWFKAIGEHNGKNKPNYGLMINKNGQGERELSQQGWVYTYLTDFDASVYHNVEEVVPAAKFIDLNGIMLDKGNNESCTEPIEISRFNAGAWADYNFDIPSDGEYTLTLTVSGQGEPTRFDPKLKVQTVNGDNAEDVSAACQFTLSGNDASYTEQALTLTLRAGKQTLRLADANPAQPSGIRISTLKLTATAGVDDIIADATDASAPTQYFDLQGRRVDNPVNGLYIARKGTKVTKIYVK